MVSNNAIFRTLANPRLSHGAARIWLFLAFSAAPLEVISMRQADICERVGIADRSTVRRYLDELRDKGLIDWEYNAQAHESRFQLKGAL